MLQAPERHEIDHHTSKLIVGLIALSMANLTSFFAATPITSISASYYEGGWSQNIFVGFLFAISAFLFAYNGETRRQMVLSKVAACAALGVAMFPCKCKTHAEIVPHVHGISAAVMFLILAFFCYVFYQRAMGKGHTQAKRRAYVYAISGIAIIASILVLAIDGLTGGAVSSKIVRLTFYGERTGLIAFGISWLTASRALPFFTTREERLLPFSDRASSAGSDTLAARK